MVQPAPRPRTDATPDTTPHGDPVNPVTAGATDALQRQSRDLLGAGSGNSSSTHGDWATAIHAGFNAAANALEKPEVQAMLTGLIISGLPTVKTTDGSTGSRNIPDSPGRLIKEGDNISASGPKVPRDDGRGMVRPTPVRPPNDGPIPNPGGLDSGTITGHTVKFPTGDLGSLNKPNKGGSDSGDSPAPSHIPGSKEFKEGAIKAYEAISAALTALAEGLTDGSIKSQVEKTANNGEIEKLAPAEDPLADGVLDITEAIDLFAEADQADAERQQKVEKLLESIPDGPVRDLMREASSQLLDSAQLDTQTIQRMLKEAKEELGKNEFWNQMGKVMTDFSPKFSEQFGIGLTLNRAENADGDMQDAILVSQRTGSGRDSGKVTTLAITETGAPQVTQRVTTISGTREQQASDTPDDLFNTFGNAALEYYFEHQ